MTDAAALTPAVHHVAPIRRIVVMGVSAVGKSTVGRALASDLAYVFVDADDLHSAANKERMARGIPLTDIDRAPWLQAVGRALAASDGMVVACSALRRSYRNLIRQAAADTFFVFLDGDPALLQQRALARVGHFMPPSLLASQFATLEPLQADEAGARVDVAAPPTEVERVALAAVRTGTG